MIEQCLKKDKEDTFYQAGCATEIVNIIKCMQELGINNDKFLKMLLKHTVTAFEEMPISWVNHLLKSASQMNCEPEMIVDHFIKIA